MSPSDGVRRDGRIRAEDLGAVAFRQRHGVRLAYVAGAMYKGIASKELVIRMGRAGLLGYLGTGGMKLERIESDLRAIRDALGAGQAFGMNLLASPYRPELERATVDLYLRHGVSRVEAAAFSEISPDLVRYRVTGIEADGAGGVRVPNRVLAKVSRPEVATAFLSPPPPALLRRWVGEGVISEGTAALAERIPMADDVCVEADSGGHTDQGVALALMPVMRGLRDELCGRHGYAMRVCVGAAGGLGTPEAIAAALVLGADFVLTGSVNQCTVEAGTSDLVKDMLQEADVQDTDMAPAGDMFEMGAQVQVFRKGLLFPTRARKLYELYRQHGSIEELDAKTRAQIETRYFKRPIAEVYEETRAYYQRTLPAAIERAERDPKYRMALIFRWYFVRAHRLAVAGDDGNRVDFQIQCGPALGAFNRWVKGTRHESWRNRHADEIGDLLMNGAARVLEERFRSFQGGTG